MIKRFLIVAMLGFALNVSVLSQEKEQDARFEFSVEYDTELQSDLRKIKWLNMLRADLSLKMAKGLSLSAATLSTAQTDEQPLVDDLQGFSNIEAENVPLTLAVLSLDWETKNTTLWAGVRNFNENYFATDLAAFFTQSSHGIFPTISFNFPIANYPVASIGVDFQWRLKEFALDASLYNGTGYKKFAGRENMFRFCPSSDGLFGALQLSHEAGYGNSHLGAALRGDRETTHAAFWAYAELNLTQRTQLLAQYSFASGRELECKDYVGLGLKQTLGKVDIGLAENYARFSEADEWTTELSASVPIKKYFALRPAVHFCHTGNQRHCVGLLRGIFRF